MYVCMYVPLNLDNYWTDFDAVFGKWSEIMPGVSTRRPHENRTSTFRAIAKYVGKKRRKNRPTFKYKPLTRNFDALAKI